MKSRFLVLMLVGVSIIAGSAASIERHPVISDAEAYTSEDAQLDPSDCSRGIDEANQSMCESE